MDGLLPLFPEKIDMSEQIEILASDSICVTCGLILVRK